VQATAENGVRRLYSRSGDDISAAFPDILAHMGFEGSIDGELMVRSRAQVAPFSDLQQRLNRKTVSRRMMEAYPAFIRAYDLLQDGGLNTRPLPFAERRPRLERFLATLNPDRFDLSPAVAFTTWDDLAAARDTSRDRGTEGLMLKRLASPYHAGRKRGDWWKWKIDPLTIDAVMVYAQAGHGRRANLYTDYTFAVRDGDALIPFTKAYSGLTDTEFNQITNWVRRNTTDRFGPVRQVKPELVFEIAFEGIRASPRHKSGVALRFPRMVRWRQDKPASEINTLDDLKEMLVAFG
jgi:DNA ligase-1